MKACLCCKAPPGSGSKESKRCSLPAPLSPRGPCALFGIVTHGMAASGVVVGLIRRLPGRSLAASGLRLLARGLNSTAGTQYCLYQPLRKFPRTYGVPVERLQTRYDPCSFTHEQLQGSPIVSQRNHFILSILALL